MVTVGKEVTTSMSPVTSVQLVALLILSYAPAFTNSQIGLEITATPNPLYYNELITMECVFGPGLTLISAEIAVFNEEKPIGYLWYNCNGGGAPTSTGIGVLSGRNAAGCEMSGSTSFSAYFVAVIVQNMAVNCSATLMKLQTSNIVKLSSSILNLVVLALPDTPQFSPAQPTFYNGVNATLTCTSRGGSPAANLLLEIKTSQMNETLHTVSGFGVTSVTWTMSKRYHNAVATCRITNHLRTTYPTSANVRQYDLTELTFSSNPVYEGDSVWCTCAFLNYCSLYYYHCVVKISAFNRTEPKGALFYDYYYNYINSSGVLNYRTATYDRTSFVAKVQMYASRNMDLDYVCTLHNYYSPSRIIGASASTHLEVLVAPSPATLIPGNLAFIDNNLVSMSCRTYSSGKPEALLQLLLKSTQQQTQLLATGTGSASIRLNMSRSWHNASIECNILNHNLSNLSIRGVMQVVHLVMSGIPDIVYTYNNDSILDCADYVLGFPEPSFTWSVPTHLNASDSNALNSGYFPVHQTQTGLVNCTATNLITRKSVTVPFVVRNAPPFESTSTKGPIVEATTGSLVAVAILVGMTVIILRQRRNKVDSQICTRCFHSKQPEAPENPGNVYVMSAGLDLAAVTEDTFEYSQSLPNAYGLLHHNLEDAGSTYSSLEMTYQNDAYAKG